MSPFEVTQKVKAVAPEPDVKVAKQSVPEVATAGFGLCCCRDCAKAADASTKVNEHTDHLENVMVRKSFLLGQFSWDSRRFAPGGS
jgi:hypothetical protein